MPSVYINLEVSVRMHVPEEVAEKITAEDLLCMACNAMNGSHGIQCTVEGVAQYDPPESGKDADAVFADVHIQADGEEDSLEYEEDGFLVADPLYHEDAGGDE